MQPNFFTVVFNVLTILFLTIIAFLGVVSLGTWLMRQPSMILVIVGAIVNLGGCIALVCGASYFLFSQFVGEKK